MDTLRLALLLFTVLNVMCLLMSQLGRSAQLTQNYYANICPDVETIVRDAVAAKLQQQVATIPATLRLFFHDCFAQGCDASVLVASTPTNTAEKDHPDNLSLAGDGFDTVIKAKAAVDAVARCTNKVSCADILAMAARDAVALAGGPNYAVELGRLDGLSSTAASVNGKLPEPSFRVGQLTGMFAANGLSQEDMIALSAAHTLGVSHCNRFTDRIYNFKSGTPADPTLNETYSAQLQASCPRNPEPDSVANLDPITPGTFDNQYFKNLQQRMGLFTSDQSLYEDSRSSRSTVNAWAQDPEAFNQAFVTAMTKLGRVGVKTGTNGNIRRDCGILN